MRRIKPLIIILFFILSFPQWAWAVCSWSGNTGTVASPYAAADVNACISDASGKTGAVIIQIPDSTPTWTESVAVDMSTGFANVTGVTIRGQNDCTVDADDRATSCATEITSPSLSFVGTSIKSFRFAHMTLINPTAVTSGTFGISGDCRSWRFDHLNMNLAKGSENRIFYIVPSVAGSDTYGLIDKNTIKVNGSELVFIQHVQAGDGGNYTWSQPAGLGTVDGIYIENNTLRDEVAHGWLPITDCNGAGKFILRYNDIYDYSLGSHDAIVMNSRGVSKFEIYENTFVYTAAYAGGSAAYLRAGRGVYYNNTWSDPGLALSSGILFAIFRNSEGGGDPWDDQPCSNTTGKACLNTTDTWPIGCTTDANCGGDAGSCVLIDGTASDPTGYPCRDQVGVTQNANGSQNGGGLPFLIWNNTKNGGAISVGGTADYIVSARDYCLAATTMPATCNGVTTTYAAYTYPHPLNTDEEEPATSGTTTLSGTGTVTIGGSGTITIGQ